MAYNRNHARALCNATELALFEASLADNITAHSSSQVRDRIKRARALRDKYRDLYKRQRLAARERTGTKKGVRSDSNARTQSKARLFEEVLARYQARADALAVGTKG
jgi:hypothetical protein